MRLSRLRNLLTIGIAACALSSCSWMEEDLSDCPNGLDVYFKYDYNIQRANMFADHVGAVTVYVFDRDNRFVTQRSAAGNSLKAHDFHIHFAGDELAPGTYSLLALAGQKDYDAQLAAPGAKFRRTQLKPGDDISKLTVTLDRGEVTADGTAPVEHEAVPLDTLWHALNVQTVTLTPDNIVDGVYAATKDTLSLTRDTKQLNITLRQTEGSSEMLDANYDVRIIDRNGLLAYDNTPSATDSRLTYAPYAQWTTDAADDGMGSAPGAVGLQAAHYELFTSRIMLHENRADDARLIITNHTNGETVVDIDLPYYLSADRDRFSIYNYSAQEFLDREHKYNMSFFLKGDRWQYMTFSIGILDWSIRIQNEEL